jgi:hypothetical protein
MQKIKKLKFAPMGDERTKLKVVWGGGVDVHSSWIISVFMSTMYSPAMAWPASALCSGASSEDWSKD